MNAVAHKYRAVQATTCSPGQLLVMMYDGLLRFLAEAKDAMDRGDRARAGERISRSLAILEQLVGGLAPEHAPELCSNLEALYLFSMSRLVEANLHRDTQKIEEVRGVLAPLRDAWKAVTSEPAKPTSP